MNLQTILLALSMAMASSEANLALVATYQLQNKLAADHSAFADHYVVARSRSRRSWS